MNNAGTRACAWVSFALMTYVPLAMAQTIETIAGGEIVLDSPALTTSNAPLHVGVGPDGNVYDYDISTAA